MSDSPVREWKYGKVYPSFWSQSLMFFLPRKYFAFMGCVSMLVWYLSTIFFSHFAALVLLCFSAFGGWLFGFFKARSDPYFFDTFYTKYFKIGFAKFHKSRKGNYYTS